MILNWAKEIQKIDPDMSFRANGGWLKTIEELDKSVKSGYSLVGDFVKSGDFEEEYSEGLYLDCNKENKCSAEFMAEGIQVLDIEGNLSHAYSG